MLAILLLAGLGCAEVEVTEAFKGNFEKSKGNKVITDYCQSCHIHKDFDSTEHMVEVQLDYKRTVFKNAEECRVCHYLEKHLVYDQFLRKTRRPGDANRGKFKSFEKKELVKMKKSRKEEASKEEVLDDGDPAS